MFALGLVLLGSVLSAQQVFRGGTDIVLLNVTVTDSDGRFVSRLDKNDFQVFEDGVLQEISNFTRDQQPIALSILLDTSTSMEKRLGVAQQAAIGFVGRLGPRDIAQIMAFDSRAETLLDFTGDRAALDTAILRTRAGGSTALYNAMYMALSDLKRVVARSPEEIRRQAIVLLSDGEDTSSLIDYDQVEESAKRSEVAVYTIGLRSKEDTPAARLQRGGLRAADAGAGFGRPRVSTSRTSRSCLASTSRSRTSWPTSTRWATPRRIPSGTAHGAGSSSR